LNGTGDSSALTASLVFLFLGVLFVVLGVFLYKRLALRSPKHTLEHDDTDFNAARRFSRRRFSDS